MRLHTLHDIKRIYTHIDYTNISISISIYIYIYCIHSLEAWCLGSRAGPAGPQKSAGLKMLGRTCEGLRAKKSTQAKSETWVKSAKLAAKHDEPGRAKVEPRSRARSSRACRVMSSLCRWFQESFGLDPCSFVFFLHKCGIFGFLGP